MSDMVIRDINAVKVHTFVDLVNYFIKVNGYEEEIQCTYGITYKGEQVTDKSEPLTFIELFDTYNDDIVYKQYTTQNMQVLFNDIVRTDSIEELRKMALGFLFRSLDNLNMI